MALSLLPQPQSVRVLGAHFDFKEVDAVVIAKRASARTKSSVQLLVDEMKAQYHLEFQVKTSARVKDPHGCIITHHSRDGIFVKTTLDKPQAYELLAAGHSLTISAVDEQGFFAATRTILQLLQEGTRIPSLKIQDWPVTPFRAFHLDLKGLTPSMAALKETIQQVSLYKFNALLVEYEDRFPFECVKDVRGPHAFTPDTLQAFLDTAETYGLEVIPLVQTLGHLEWLLRHEPYRELSEIPQAPQCLCMADAKAVKLVREMVREIIKAHPNSRFIHLGADEVFQLGAHPETQKMIEKAGGKEAAFVDHTTKLIRLVKAAKGKNALIWDDMLREADEATLKKIPKNTGLVYWKYEGNGGQFKPELLPKLSEYRRAGLDVYAGSAIRGAEQFYSNIPNYRHRMDNVDWWVEAAETHGPLAGHIATSWSRFNGNLTPCEPPATQWFSALYAAERLWTGLGSSRESFERRMLVGFYGLRADSTEVALAHYGVNEDHAKEAAEVFGRAKRSARRGKDVLELLELLADIEVISSDRRKYTEQLAHMLPALESGRADAMVLRMIRNKLPNVGKEIERLYKELSRVLGKTSHKDEVEEFLQDRLLVCERLLGHLKILLKRSSI